MVKCDGCGTEQDVKRQFITLWNGHVVDLCLKCAAPFVSMLDALSPEKWFNRA